MLKQRIVTHGLDPRLSGLAIKRQTKPESVTRGRRIKSEGDPRVHGTSGAMDARVTLGLDPRAGHDAEKLRSGRKPEIKLRLIPQPDSRGLDPRTQKRPCRRKGGFQWKVLAWVPGSSPTAFTHRSGALWRFSNIVVSRGLDPRAHKASRRKRAFLAVPSSWALGSSPSATIPCFNIVLNASTSPFGPSVGCVNPVGINSADDSQGEGRKVRERPKRRNGTNGRKR
jgi:hypothetical protein